MKKIVSYEFEDNEEAIEQLRLVKDYICYKTFGLSAEDKFRIKELVGDILEEIEE